VDSTVGWSGVDVLLAGRVGRGKVASDEGSDDRMASVSLREWAVGKENEERKKEGEKKKGKKKITSADAAATVKGRDERTITEQSPTAFS
jgi:hypothetical protein